MASEARINITASDDASGTIRSVQGGLRNLAGNAKGSILTGVGLGAGISAWRLLGDAIHGAIGFVGDAVRKAGEEEASIARLGASLEANVKGWDGNTEAIEARLEAGKDLGFSDDEQRDSLALLVAATGDVNKSFDIMATAMDLARLKGVDLKDASEALIKVDSGRFRLLAALGIELGEGATATEALAAVQAIAGGQALEFADTQEGVADRLQVAFDDLQEDLGKEFQPVLMELMLFAKDELIPAIAGFMEEVKKIDWEGIGKNIQGVIGFFEDLWTAITDVTSAIEDFGRSLPGYTPAGGHGSFGGGGSGVGGSGGSSGFGSGTVVLDGRELQNSVVRWNYLTSSGGASRLPR